MMGKTNILFLLILFTSKGWAAQPNIDIRTTIGSESVVYNGQRITVTCTARLSTSLSWRYRGNVLFVLSSYVQGKEIVNDSDPEVIALVIRSNNISGEEMIESQLIFYATSSSPNFTITCHNVDLDLSESVTYYTTNQEATELTHSGVNNSICPGDTLVITCTARNTSVIQWTSPTLFVGNDLYCTQNSPALRNENVTVHGIPIILSIECSFATKHGGTLIPTSVLTFDVPGNVNITCGNIDLGNVVNKIIETANASCATTAPDRRDWHIPTDTTNHQSNTGRISISLSYKSMVYIFFLVTISSIVNTVYI